MKEGKSVVIDNYNADKKERLIYGQIAKDLNIPARCFYFDVPKPLAIHNDKMKQLNSHRKHLSKKVG